VHFLGFLSDAAILHYLKTTTYFAAFFPTGVRANNSSVQTAMQAGAVVITNLDDRSPDGFNHMDSLIDIQTCSALPTDEHTLSRISRSASAAADRYDWGGLIRRLTNLDERKSLSRADFRVGQHLASSTSS
jgi:hypothetical protein